MASNESASRAGQLAAAAEVAQRYAIWRKTQMPFKIAIDSELKKLVDSYGGSGDEELAAHFLTALAKAEAELDKNVGGQSQ